MTSPKGLVGCIDRHFAAAPARRIGVAVSGGSDSTALMHLLTEWGGAEAVHVATVDHSLRAAAADEARAVALRCKELGLPHETLVWRGWDGKGNLQDHARANRYALLAEWSKRQQLDTVAIGHTEDDVAETFLMRLSRQAGLDGLSSMNAVFDRAGMRFDRPLLRARRADLRAYLAARDEPWIEDPSNDDDRFDRIKARQALEALAPLGIDAATLGNVSRQLADARGALAGHVAEVASRVCKEISGDLVFDLTATRQAGPEVMRRLISGALMWISGEDYPPRRDALAGVIDAISEARTVTLHGCLIATTPMTLRLSREPSAAARGAARTLDLWDGRWHLDGPHGDDLTVRALGDAITETPWRETGLPRRSLLASPAVWRGETLVAAPVAGLSHGWRASATGRGTFASFLLSR